VQYDSSETKKTVNSQSGASCMYRIRTIIHGTDVIKTVENISSLLAPSNQCSLHRTLYVLYRYTSSSMKYESIIYYL